MSEDSPAKFFSTSTPITKSFKQLRQRAVIESDDESKENSIQLNKSNNDDDSKENGFVELDKSDTLDTSNERSRSIRNAQIDSSDDSMTFKGKTNQSMRERLMRKEHQKERSKIPVKQQKTPLRARIDSNFESQNQSKNSDKSTNSELIATMESLAALNFSNKMTGNRYVEDRSIVLDSPPNEHRSRNSSNSSSNSGELENSLLEDIRRQAGGNYDQILAEMAVIPDSPPRQQMSRKGAHIVDDSQSTENSKLDSYEDSFIDDENASEQDKSSNMTQDSDVVDISEALKKQKAYRDSSIMILTPQMGFPAGQTKIPMFMKPKNTMAIPPIPQQQPSTSGLTSQQQRGPPIIPAHTLTKDEQKTKAYELVAQNKRLFGGQMNANRMGVINLITNDALDALHKAISTAPDEKVRSETPQGLRVKLLPHQQHGLAWMLWREKQYPPSGILADDMGLGKTISLISLILQRKNDRLAKNISEDEKALRERMVMGNHLIKSHATLIVAPASVLMQWDKEIKDRVDGRLRHIVCHGQNRERYADRLAKYDIVLTTYGTLTSELGGSLTNSPFTYIAWERVILDEAHKIKNRTSQISKSICLLHSVNRWCLTGTPIHNELWDLFSLIRFMKISPFDQEAHWKTYIMSGSKCSERLNTLVKGILLRRVKTQIDAITNEKIINLPDRNYSVVTLKMEGIEEHCYQLMFEVSRQKAQQFIRTADGLSTQRPYQKNQQTFKNPFLFGQREVASGDRFQAMNYLLVLLLRLRQACVHLSLTRQAIDLEAFKNDGGDENVENEVLNELERSMSQLNVSSNKNNDEEHNREVEAIFQPSYLTAKIKAVLSHLDQVIEKKDKCVLVSQWTSVLAILEAHLKSRQVRYTSITGQILPKNRQMRIDDFNRTNAGAQVMLLSLNAGGVGLNLVGGNHLFIVDLHWNPAMENQACDRIYRVGQTKNVFIHKFVVENTIEQRVMDLQEKKTQLAQSVLQGAASKNLTKLTVNDLKFLFELNRNDKTAKPQ